MSSRQAQTRLPTCECVCPFWLPPSSLLVSLPTGRLHHYKTARTVAVREGETINARALTAIFKQIIANHRAGGWRKVKPES
jgi:hypothetical protein